MSEQDWAQRFTLLAQLSDALRRGVVTQEQVLEVMHALLQVDLQIDPKPLVKTGDGAVWVGAWLRVGID